MHTIYATSIQPVVPGIFAMSAGRLGASAAAVIGLIAIGLAGLARARGSEPERAGGIT